jgi:hypothetical protein
MGLLVKKAQAGKTNEVSTTSSSAKTVGQCRNATGKFATQSLLSKQTQLRVRKMASVRRKLNFDENTSENTSTSEENNTQFRGECKLNFIAST